MYKKAVYISELNLPSSSAYSIHVMKMCSALAKQNYLVHLFTISSKNKDELFNDYKCKKKFQINSYYNNKINFNFYSRLIYAYMIFKKIKKVDLIISRSIVASLFLSLLKKKNILELHHEPTGLSKLFFNITKNLYIKKYLKIILLHPNILNKINLRMFKYTIEDDAVDIEDFKAPNLIKNDVLSDHFLYIGSFYSGKCLEIIEQIAIKEPHLSFDLYGSKKTLKKSTLEYPKNIKFFDSVTYSEIPNILRKYKFVLMPYLNQVRVRSKNLDVGLNMSPLKMFDYLAAGKCIIASKLEVYNHILSDGYNSILIDTQNINKWCEYLNLLYNNKMNYDRIAINARNTAKNFTWDKRVERIILFNN